MVPPETLEEMRAQSAALPVHPLWLALVQALIAGPTINAVFGFGEELGWRGLLLRELAPLGFWRSSYLIGLIWGLWHAPLILRGTNYPQHPELGVALMTVFTMLLAPLMSYVTLRANSVIAAAIFHGTLNASAGMALLPLKGGSDLTVGMTGLSGLVVLAIANLGVWVILRSENQHAGPKN
jgi:membrane protease YdiL (CAAX protease family)